VNGYSRPEFRGIKTTLAGVEEIWHRTDWASVRSGRPLPEAFDTQCQRIGETMERRRLIALGIARCAGWVSGDDDR